MAAPVSNNKKKKSSCWDTPEVYKHHEQHKVCISRAKYREGRRDRAVKVYTINLESRYVMVQGVPAIGLMTELVALCALYGAVEEYRPLDEYPAAEEFTEVYLVKFQKLTSARAAKRRMDGTSFYGGILHVCYVPEYETVEDTRLKLQDRRRYVNRTAQMIAKERSEVREGDEEATAPDNKTTPSQMTTASVAAAAAAAAAGQIHLPLYCNSASAAAAHHRSPEDHHVRPGSRPGSNRYVHPSSEDSRAARQGSSSSSLHVDHRRRVVHDDAAESWTSSSSHHHAGGGGFPPLLPLPPREEHRYRRDNPHRTTSAPTEDHMGTLHNAVAADHQKQQSRVGDAGRCTASIGGDGGRSGESSRPTPEKTPGYSSTSTTKVGLVPRFVPRTQHLENRKRKMEEEEAKKSHLSSSSSSSCGVTGGESDGQLVGPLVGPSDGGPLVGPKLPEPPRVDMEDASLNTTVRRIRSTLKQVSSVPDIKPVPKKTKPRRRI